VTAWACDPSFAAQARQLQQLCDEHAGPIELGFIPHLGTAVQQYGLGGLAAATTRTIGFPASAPTCSASQPQRSC
jgi:hypothetical protein